MRKFVPVTAGVFALFFIFKWDFFAALLNGLMESGPLIAGSVFALLMIGAASISVPRVCLGLTGWIRHLPAGGLFHRRLAGAAVLVSLFPVLLMLAFFAGLVHMAEGVPVLALIVGLPAAGWAAAQCVLPVQRRVLSIPPAAAACVFASSNRWFFLLLSLFFLVAADGLAGPLKAVRRHPRFSRVVSEFSLNAAIAVRALRFRFLAAYVPSLLILGLCRISLGNNSFSPAIERRVGIFGGALSLFLFCALLAGRLSERRPPWPWVRSLPWSAGARVTADALFLGLPALLLLPLFPVPAGPVVWPVIGGLPWFALTAASQMRRARPARWGAAGRTAVIGAAAAVGLSVFPWISLPLLALTPVAMRSAAREEKSFKVSRWDELQHLAAGDPLSWSER